MKNQKKHSEIVDLFENPTTEYKGKPFWSWNGELRGEELREAIAKSIREKEAK